MKKMIALKNKIMENYTLNNSKENLSLCNKLIQASEETQDKKMLIFAYYHRSFSHYFQGNIQNAFKDSLMHKEIAFELKDPTEKLRSYNLLFILYAYHQSTQLCKKMISESMDLALKINDQLGLVNTYRNYVDYLLMTKNYEKSIDYGKQAWGLYQNSDLELPQLETHVLLGLTRGYLMNKEFKKARKLINRLSQNKILQYNQRIQALFFKLKGRLYYEEKSYNLALKYYDACNDYFIKHKGSNWLVENYEKLIEIYTALNKREALIETQSKYIQLLKKMKTTKVDEIMTFSIREELIEEKASLEEIRKENRILTIKNKRILEQSKAMESVLNDLWDQYNESETESKRDFLTGIYNRQALEEVLGSYVNSQKIKNEELSCIIFDIDHFKKVNDTFGHLAGDKVLKQTCRLCSELIDKEHIFGRYGGDEFVIILKDTNLNEAKNMANRVLKEVSNKKVSLERENRSISITLSMGISNTQIHNPKDVKDFIYLADLGLYDAKRKGRNRFEIYEEKN